MHIEPTTPEQHRAQDAWDAGWQARAEQAHLDLAAEFKRGYDRGLEDAGSPAMLGICILMLCTFIVGFVIAVVIFA
jgi:hypothetical protein